MKREKEFRDIAATLNLMRIERKSGTFNSKELKEIFKGVLPTDCSSKVELVRANIIVRVKRGEYCFPSNPIHWTSVRNFYKQCREKSQQYRNAEKKIPSEEEILAMIEIVKAHGYLVYKRM